MKTSIPFLNDQFRCNNMVNAFLISPLFLYGGVIYYNNFIEIKSIPVKIGYILFYSIISLILIFKPYVISYSTKNQILEIENVSQNNYEIKVRLFTSTTRFFGLKLMKFNCSPKSIAKYNLDSESIKMYKKGDEINLLLGADTKIIHIL